MLVYKKVVANSLDCNPTGVRKSIPFTSIKYPGKLMRSCVLSKQIYNDAAERFSISQFGSTTYVCFKGCTTKKDLMSGLDIRKARILGETIHVHNGFYQHYVDLSKTLEYSLCAALTDGTSNIVFTGHSAGGCIAQIASVLFEQNMGTEGINAHCISFGSPKIGSIDFKYMIEGVHEERLLRVETYNDIVCLLPMHVSFHHAGKELILHNGDLFAEDKTNGFYSSYYTDYLAFLQQLSSSNLLDKKHLDEMIDGHYSECYVKNIHTLFKKYVLQK